MEKSIAAAQPALFTNKDLKRLIFPLIVEQALALSVGMFDTMMIASLGEAAMSGVSLVDGRRGGCGAVYRGKEKRDGASFYGSADLCFVCGVFGDYGRVPMAQGADHSAVFRQHYRRCHAKLRNLFLHYGAVVPVFGGI